MLLRSLAPEMVVLQTAKMSRRARRRLSWPLLLAQVIAMILLSGLGYVAVKQLLARQGFGAGFELAMLSLVVFIATHTVWAGRVLWKPEAGLPVGVVELLDAVVVMGERQFAVASIESVFFDQGRKLAGVVAEHRAQFVAAQQPETLAQLLAQKLSVPLLATQFPSYYPLAALGNDVSNGRRRPLPEGLESE